MKFFKIFLMFFTLLNYWSFCQSNSKICNCPKSKNVGSEWPEKPDTIFYFASGKAIGLCGYREVDPKTHKISFVEFVLHVCGEDSIIIGGGWFLQNSKLYRNNDTLFLQDCPSLPTGNDFKYKETPWTIEKIYFSRDHVKIKKTINRGIRHYNEQEIRKVLREYEKIKPSHSNLDDNSMVLVDRLFIATISGSEKARKYFEDVPKKFAGLDAFGGEYYEDLKGKLLQWDKK